MSEKSHFSSLESEELNNRRIRMNEFRSSGYLTDVSVIVGDVTYPAHKLILASHSPVFQVMFNSNTLETQSGQVVITDVSTYVFSWFLDFLYLEALPTIKEMTLANVVDLMVCADKYQTTSLMLALDEELFDRLKADNAVEIFEIADSLYRVTLKKRCISLMCKKLLKIKPERVNDFFTNNKTVVIKVIEHSHKEVRSQYGELPALGSSNCSEYDVTDLDIKWNSLTHPIEGFRPKGIKLSLLDRPLNFVVFFNDYGVTFNTKPRTSLSIYPTSTVPEGVYIGYSVSVECPKFNKSVSKEDVLAWNERFAHPILGHRRVELVRWDWCHPKDTSINLEIDVYDNLMPRPLTPTKVEEWKVDGKVQLDGMDIDEQEDEDSVELIFGDYMVNVPRYALLERTEPYSDDYQRWLFRTGDIVVESSEATGLQIVRYILSGLFPDIDKVDVPLLEAAWTLNLRHLSLYAEQALVWNLNPGNVAAIATYGIDNSHAWLIWASAQYLKFHLDLVTRTTEDWKNLPDKYLQILIGEMRYKFDPCLLPAIANNADK